MSHRLLALLAVLALALLWLASCGGMAGTNPSSTDTWQYTALGDSLAFGALAQQGYVPRYADNLRTDTGAAVTTRNLGVPGWQSTDLLRALRSDSGLRAMIANSQVVTWDIGGNDLSSARSRFKNGTCSGADNQDCLRAAVSNFSANWDAIVSEILLLRNPQQTILRTMDIYNPFVATDMAAGDFTTLQPYLDQVNAHIHASEASNGIRVANVHEAFNGPDGTRDAGAAGLLALDNFHPNDAGHKVIADQLRALQYAPLR